MTACSCKIDWRWRRMFNIVLVGFRGDENEAKRHAVRLFAAQLRTERRLGEARHDKIEEEADLPPAG